MSHVKGQPGKTTALRVRWPHFLSRFFCFDVVAASRELCTTRVCEEKQASGHWVLPACQCTGGPDDLWAPHWQESRREEQLPFHIYNRNGFEMHMFLFPWLQAFAGFLSSVLFSYWSTLHCLWSEGPAVEYLVVPKRDGWDNLLYINVLFQIRIGSGHSLLQYFPRAPT